MKFKKIIFYHLRDSGVFQPHYIAKKEMIEINEQTTTKVEYPKNCYSCKRCLSGTYQIGAYTIDEGTLICELTGSVLVEPDGTEVNITACEHYKSDYVESFVNYIEMQPLPF